AAAADSGRHLPGDSHDRRRVELRVVQAGQQVRRPRTRDGEAHGRTTRELAVGAGGERRRALVPDSDVGDLTALLGLAQRVGEAQVRMPDHAEYVADSEGDQRLDQHVADGADGLGRVGEFDVHAVVPLVDAKTGDSVAESTGGTTGDRVVVIAVPGTP